MKKLLSLFALLLCITAQQADAQPFPPEFAITSAGDSTWGTLCSSPAPIAFVMEGWAMPFDQQTGEVWCTYHFGDGTSTTVQAYLYGGVVGMNFFSSIDHIYQSPGSYTVKYEVYGTANGIDYYDSLIVVNDIIISDTCGTIGGVAFYDQNDNCTMDQGELPLQNIMFGLYENGVLITYDWTNADGDYDFYAPLGGNYEVRLLTAGYTDICPGTAQSVGTVPNTDLHFALSCDADLFDLEGLLSGAGFRPGFDGWLTATAFNNGCLPQSGQLIIELDPITTYNGTSYPQGVVSVSGSTITIDLDALSVVGNGAWFQIGLYTDPGAFLDTQACFDMTITPTVGDADPANNAGTYCFPVTNSWDPNDKAVSPGVGENGAVLPDTKLTYHVRFQNTGTAEAVNIHVMDTIDANLDLSTFRVLATSHTMELFMLQDRAIKFNFPNINLLDSTTNEPLSHGFITYSIEMNPSLAEGTVIENTAHIFFDFNPAVVTNTAVSTIDLFTGIDEEAVIPTVNIYPNPTSGILNLTGVGAAATAEVIDAMGRVVLRPAMQQGSSMVDVSSLPTGAYLIRVLDNQGLRMGRFVKH